MTKAVSIFNLANSSLGLLYYLFRVNIRCGSERIREILELTSGVRLGSGPEGLLEIDEVYKFD